MKKNDIFDAFESLDPKFVEEAAPNINKKARKPLAFRLIAIAACIALLVTGVVIGTLLLNRDGDPQDATDEIPKRIKQYQDSEYFEVIRSLDAYFESRKKDKVVNEYGEGDFQNIQITDNQTPGVEEADKIKRTDTHIFYMDGKCLNSYRIDGDKLILDDYYFLDSYENEFFLSADGKTITVISKANTYVSSDQPYFDYTEVISLDSSDPKRLKEKARCRVKGEFISARVTNGKLMLFVSQRVYEGQINFSKPETYLPAIDRENGYEILPDCEIICNERMTNSTYTVALVFDENDLTIEKNIAALSYSGDPYVSEDKIFFNGDGRLAANAMPRTNILAVDYSGEKFEVLGSASVHGYLKDQWSMDEHEGILRVVTTTKTSADLYCISLESFEEIASVKGFAPEGEVVHSVRFDGTNAYVCTAKQVANVELDPVFFFDLSDLNNITYKDTGTIEGLSNSLVDFCDGYLLGIGHYGGGGPTVFKMEIYKEVEDRIVSACKYELPNIVFPFTYKAYYIDRENQLLGFGRWGEWNKETEKSEYLYTLLKFDAEKEQLVELLTVNLSGRDSDSKRGVYIDGYMYMFGENDYKVVPVDLNNIDGNQPDTEEIPDEQT
ncbi:MAG: beta-propeller domain-containing protein [Clostridia bacterium]|nr:beta-propeller domain-containing protein [Clostridia bacterium]